MISTCRTKPFVLRPGAYLQEIARTFEATGLMNFGDFPTFLQLFANFPNNNVSGPKATLELTEMVEKSILCRKALEKTVIS